MAGGQARENVVSGKAEDSRPGEGRHGLRIGTRRVQIQMEVEVEVEVEARSAVAWERTLEGHSGHLAGCWWSRWSTQARRLLEWW